MWAKQKHFIQRTRLSGFTIVELLIVIVVIAVLAAISIAAYNGIMNRARTATLNSDLANAAKTMGADNASNGSYALSASAVNGGKGLPASPGTTYQFRSTGTTYCITGTNSKISYMINNVNTAPVPGGCSGDLVNDEISNLAGNPSVETNMSGWGSTWMATPVTRVTTGIGIVNGSAAMEANLTTDNASGVGYWFTGLKAATTYTASGYVTLVSGDGSKLRAVISDGMGTRAWTAISSSLVTGQPVRISISWVSSSNPNGDISLMRDGPTTGTGTIRVDGLMITEGSTLYNYADGASSGWRWSGTANNSTSVGPPL